MAAVPTVKVHYNGSFAYINESEFDPQIHLLWQEGDEAIVAELKAQAEAEAAAAAALFAKVESEDGEDEEQAPQVPAEPAEDPQAPAEPVAEPVEVVPTEPAAADQVETIDPSELVFDDGQEG